MFEVNNTTKKVGIGTENPATTLEVAVTGSPTIRVTDLDGTNQFGQILSNNGTFVIESRNDTSDGQIIFRGRDNTGTTERLRIGSAGQIGLGGANYGTSGQVLTSNGSGSAPTWQTVSGGGGGGISNVVEDTTPQLGGNLDLNNKDITGTGNLNVSGIVTATSFSGAIELSSDTSPQLGGNLFTNGNDIFVADNDLLRLGSGYDLTIFHNGTNAFLTNHTGDLIIGTYGIEYSGDDVIIESADDFEVRLNTGINPGSGTTAIYATGGGSVALNHSGSTKFETTGYGATITGGLEVSGIVTASSYRGDGSQLTGVEAASFLFNTGITSSVSAVATGVGSTILTLPLLDGQKYIIHSILASNIAVGNTEVNFVGAFDFHGGERSYFAHQIPIPTGTSVEMLKQPQVLNPNDKIIVRSTDFDRVGADNIIDVYVSYEEKTSTDLIGIGIGTVGLALTSTTGIYTSSTYPSVVQSIRLVNKVDTGPKIASVSISNGVSTTFLVDNLIVPKYGSIEILDNPKSIQTNDVVQVQLDEGASIDVQLSAKKITN